MLDYLKSDEIQAIYFDAVGTLVYPYPPVSEAYGQVGRRWGMALTNEEIDKRFRIAFHRQDEMDKARGNSTSEERERERWTAIVAEVFRDQSNPPGLLEELWQHFAAAGNWRCFPDVAMTLQILRERGLQIGIASNFDGRLRAIVEGMPELRSCRNLAISSEIGWRKPAPEFFTGLQKTADVPLGETLLVGDDWENDFLGGQACGCQVVLLDRKNNRPEVPSIHSLTELNSLLK